MTTYIYPQNLKAKASLWLWSLKDIAIIGVAALISIIALAQAKTLILIGLTAGYAFLTIRLDDQTVLDFIKNAVRYFITSQQIFYW